MLRIKYSWESSRDRKRKPCSQPLRAIRGDIAGIKDELHFLNQRVAALEQHFATLMTMLPAYND